MKNRLITLFLTILMILSIITPVFAEDAIILTPDNYHLENDNSDPESGIFDSLMLTSGNNSSESQADKLVEIMSSQHGETTHNDSGKHIECAAFIAYAAKKAGMTNQQIDLSATVPSPWVPRDGTSKTFKFLNQDGTTNFNCQAWTWKDFKEGKYTPIKGDIVIYGSYSTSNLSIADVAKKGYSRTHAGVIRNNSSTTKNLYTVEGNTSQDGVKKRTNAEKTRNIVDTETGKIKWDDGYRYVTEFIRPNYSGSQDYENSQFLNSCKYYPSYANLTVKKSTTLKSLPCSKETNPNSMDVETLSVNTPLVATGLRWNGYYYWYETIYTGSNSDYQNKKVYIFAGDVTATARFDCGEVTGNKKMPEGQLKRANLEKNKGYDLFGTINAGYLELVTVGAYVLEDFGTSCALEASTGIEKYPVSSTEPVRSWSINKTTFKINNKSTTLDKSCKFLDLNVGSSYQYVIAATLKNNITKDAKTLETDENKTSMFKILESSSFSVVDNVTCKLIYNANGGSNPPKEATVNSGTKPTLKEPGGMSRSGYTFVGWDLNKDAKVAQYQSGDTFTVKKDTTLYAIWRDEEFTFTYNANGGSGTMSGTSVTYGNDFNVPSNKFTCSGYTFKGFNAYCPSIQKWYVDGQGWLTDSEISSGGYEKRLYNYGSVIELNHSWTDGTNNSTEYTLYAVWQQSGGSGSSGSLSWSFKETLNKSVYAHMKGPVEQFSKETGLETEHKAPELTLCCGKLIRFPEKRCNAPLPGSSQAATSAR